MSLVMRCSICATDLTNAPAAVDRSAGLAFCPAHASSQGELSADRDFSACGHCGFRYATSRAIFDTGPASRCPNCGVSLTEAQGERASGATAAIRAVEEWMDHSVPGAPRGLAGILESWARDWSTDWGVGTRSTIIDVLGRCVDRDMASSDTGVDLLGAAPGQRLAGFGVQTPPEGWTRDGVGQSLLRFGAGSFFHLLARVTSESYALIVHSAGSGVQELAGVGQEELLDAASAAEVEAGMYTLSRESLNRDYGGSVERLARAWSVRKVYESDAGFHTVQYGAPEEEAILRDPSIRNARLVWERSEERAHATVR